MKQLVFILKKKKEESDEVLGFTIKINRMISIHFQGKSFNVKVTKVYAPVTDGEEAEAEQFYEDLQELLELTPKEKKMCFSSQGVKMKKFKKKYLK